MAAVAVLVVVAVAVVAAVAVGRRGAKIERGTPVRGTGPTYATAPLCGFAAAQYASVASIACRVEIPMGFPWADGIPMATRGSHGPMGVPWSHGSPSLVPWCHRITVCPWDANQPPNRSSRPPIYIYMYSGHWKKSTIPPPQLHWG